VAVGSLLLFRTSINDTHRYVEGLKLHTIAIPM
jgi:hypothetical protein